jgi:hypothetical protein
VTQAFAKLMDSVQPMTVLAQKIGVRRSPFEREPRAATPAGGTSSAPTPSVPPPAPPRSS